MASGYAFRGTNGINDGGVTMVTGAGACGLTEDIGRFAHWIDVVDECAYTLV